MSEERAFYNASQQGICKNCGYEIVHQGKFWRHIEGTDPVGYFGPDGFWVICGKPELAEETLITSQDDPRHFLVTLIRDGRAIKGPIYINAVNHMAAARLAYDKLPAKDSDTIRVWTLSEFDRQAEPVEYAAGNLRFNQPIPPKNLSPVISEEIEFNRQFEGETQLPPTSLSDKNTSTEGPDDIFHAQILKGYQDLDILPSQAIGGELLNALDDATLVEVYRLLVARKQHDATGWLKLYVQQVAQIDLAAEAIMQTEVPQ
ncbi:MAG: hypothetical protein BroJett011_14440 [Chloroflexota bacterium]|nr:MAG: hypothetical protein BroJett011_14440 [Chloroflexota bacterium]